MQLQTALLLVVAAVAAFWRVRDTSTSTELKQTVSAAVDDLQRLTNIK